MSRLFGNFIEQAEAEQEDPKAKRLKMIKRQVLQKKVQAVRQGAGEDIVAHTELEGEVIEEKKGGLKQARKNIGMDPNKPSCWKGYKAKGTKMKGGKSVPNCVKEEDYHSGQGEKVQKRTKKWMDKKGQKGAPGLDAMKARTAEHEAKRGVKEELSRRSKPSAKAKMAKLDAVLKRREDKKIAEKQALKNEGWLGKKKEEKKPQKAMDAGARAKRKLQRKEYAAKVSGSEDNVPDEMREGVGSAVKAVGKAAGKAVGFAAKALSQNIDQTTKSLSNPDLKPKIDMSSKKKEGGASAAKTQADKAHKARVDARKKAIKKIKDDRRERASKAMTADKAANKVKKEGEDKKFKADSEKPIVAEFVDHLWEASKKCKKCGKVYTGKSCSCGY